MHLGSFAVAALLITISCGGTSFSPTTTGDASANPVPQDGGSGDGAVVATGGSPADAGPGGNAQSIPCENATCAIPGQSCCIINNANPPPDFSYECVLGTTCPQPAPSDSGVGHVASLQCTGAANCPGNQVCCMYEQKSPKQVVSQCMATCTGPGQAQLCDPNVPPSQSGCPASAPCSSHGIGDWDIPSGFATCGGIGS